MSTLLPLSFPVRKGLSSSTLEDVDCACATTTFSGKPSKLAKGINAREAIRNGYILSLDSEKLKIDDLLEKRSVSIVVFLRSLG
ncbi:unnamed protein product [Pseudo-nitzschia multistriata]|uniref:Uncharacterized protein n=1 Tax=Pseudo-nitzschia multistriata TaxID=183589 RepID=A0A448ZSL4_9STRA|nr:unnamed protein product [Pseudo-nitzschia multistriata]